jgi:outer membrane protein
MSKNISRSLLVAAIALPGAFPAYAEVDALVRDAQAAISQGQAQQAYNLLEPQEVTRAGDPDFDFVFGVAANGAGQYSRAIMAMERVLVAQPENNQARAELGRALYAVGDTRGARTALSESKLQGVTMAAGETIDQLLQAVDRVDAGGQSSYKGYVEAGVGHDSNVNSGPADRNFAVPAFGGSVFTLLPSSAKTAADFVSAGAGFSGRHVLDPRWSIIGNVTGAAQNYSGDASQFNILQADANLGISYRVERDEYTLVGQGGIYDIDNSRVRNLAGFVGEWTRRLDGFRQLSTYLQWSRMEYPQQRIADVDRTVLGFTYAHLLRSGFLAYGGAYTGEERVRAEGVPHLGHQLVGARGGFQQPLTPALALFATLAYEHRRFGGSDPLFLVTRHDDQSQASLGLSWVVSPNWRVTPQVSRVEVRSNLGIATYDKTVLSVVARREF